MIVEVKYVYNNQDTIIFQYSIYLQGMNRNNKQNIFLILCLVWAWDATAERELAASLLDWKSKYCLVVHNSSTDIWPFWD